jgi:hypothetical protein
MFPKWRPDREHGGRVICFPRCATGLAHPDSGEAFASDNRPRSSELAGSVIIELGFQRRLDVDIAEHAESFVFQGFGDFRDGCIEGQL